LDAAQALIVHLVGWQKGQGRQHVVIRGYSHTHHRSAYYPRGRGTLVAPLRHPPFADLPRPFSPFAVLSRLSNVNPQPSHAAE
jgi:hypothetical protein